MRSYYGSLYGSCPVKSAGLKSTPPNSTCMGRPSLGAYRWVKQSMAPGPSSPALRAAARLVLVVSLAGSLVAAAQRMPANYTVVEVVAL